MGLLDNLFNSDEPNKDNEDLVAYLDKIKEKFDKSIHEKFQNYLRYYHAEYNDDEKARNIQNQYNIVKGIVETKVTQVIQGEITTTIVPKNSTFSDKDKIKIADELAAVGDDINKHIQRVNKWDMFKEDTARTGGILGMSIGRVSWDAEGANGLGEVKVEELDPLMCKWDNSANNIDGMNYFFYEPEVNILTLKKKYAIDHETGEINQEMMDKLNELSPVKLDPKSSASNKSPQGVISYQTDVGAGQAYTYGTQGMARSSENIKLTECYIVDDSVFLPDKSEGEKQKEQKEKWRFQYPNGRYIVYIVQNKNKLLLEDRPIDYPFGFPIEIFTWMPSKLKGQRIIGNGEIKDLIPTQDKLNKLYIRLSKLVQQYQSYIVFDPKMNNLKLEDFTDDFLLAAENLSASPLQVVTNNTLSEINEVVGMIKTFKQEAMEIARINETMLSGKHEKGVTSAKQVEELKQNPLTSIDAIQRRFKDFIIRVTNKALTVAQLFYNVPRTIRMAEGKQYVELPTRLEPLQNPETGESSVNPEQAAITIYDKETQKIVNEIKSDLSLFEFECEIIAGSSMSRSPQENAALTMQLVQMGLFSGQYPLETVKLVLRATDFPNRTMIINELEAKAKSQEDQPQQLPQAKDLGLSFKDLPPFAQEQWLKNAGFTIPQPPQIPTGPIPLEAGKINAIENAPQNMLG